VRVAAYQASLQSITSPEILDLIRERVEWCEAEQVDILCCPEAVLGGLADYAGRPADFAIESGRLDEVLAPLASESVTTILGFTEIENRRLYNSAAVFHKGRVIGLYRKLHPAINRSVYEAGDKLPVFKVGELTFGIVICLDSTYSEPARIMAAQGATALFVPTNNGMPPAKGGAELVAEPRTYDIALATANNVFVIRADVAGNNEELVSFGSSAIVGPDGAVLQSAKLLSEDLIFADIGR